MKRIINGALLVVVLGGVAALIFAVMSWGDDPAKKEVAPAAPKIVYMSTEGVVANIERRLQGQAGFAVKAKCPKKVDEAVGSKFRCSVRKAGRDDKIAIATVKINGENGQFTWSSKPYKG